LLRTRNRAMIAAWLVVMEYKLHTGSTYGANARFTPQTLVALPGLARAAVIGGHEHQVPPSHLG
jgi:hypothetical protein